MSKFVCLPCQLRAINVDTFSEIGITPISCGVEDGKEDLSFEVYALRKQSAIPIDYKESDYADRDYVALADFSDPRDAVNYVSEITGGLIMSEKDEYGESPFSAVLNGYFFDDGWFVDPYWNYGEKCRRPFPPVRKTKITPATLEEYKRNWLGEDKYFIPKKEK